MRLRLVDRTVRLLNGGFPVIFDGRVNCVPPNDIQVTRALMLGAAMQAITTSKRGVIALDPALCEWVERTYKRFAAT
jgi:hypothetical protein